MRLAVVGAMFALTVIACSSSTLIDASNVSAILSIAFAAVQAAVFHSPPAASAIASSGFQFARRRFSKPRGISGVALAIASTLSASQRIS